MNVIFFKLRIFFDVTSKIVSTIKTIASGTSSGFTISKGAINRVCFETLQMGKTTFAAISLQQTNINAAFRAM